MSKEHEKQTITELAVKLASIGPVQGYQTRTVYKDGKLTFTAETIEPFTVDEDGCVIGSKSNEKDAPPFSGNDDIGLVFPGWGILIGPRVL